MTDAMRKRAEAVAADLLGTAKCLHDVATDAEQNAAAFCGRLDELIFCCDACGWWCSMDDEANNIGCELVCDDCQADADGDE